VPLVLLLVSISIVMVRGSFPNNIARFVGRLGLLGIVVAFLSGFHLDYFRAWKFDAGSQEAFLRLRSLNGDYSRGIGIDWRFEPSLNFYRTLYNETRIPEFTRMPLSSVQRYFVLMPHFGLQRKFIQDHRLSIIFQHPVSHAIIGIKS